MTPFIALAPMEGVVDFVVRDLLTRIGGIDLCVTEFVRVTDKVLPDHVFHKYCPELKNGGKTQNGVPCFVQLLGGQPEPLAANAERVWALGAPGVDLNFGCPAKTVNRHDGGATLLKNPDRLYKIISTIKQRLPDDYPVTAKVRLGFDDKSLAEDIARAVSEAKAYRLTIHARTRAEGYRPPAHWEYIRKMRDVSTVPVVANGDIWSVDDYFRCREISGCDNIALGRSLIAKPDLARLIKWATTLKAGDPLSWQQILTSYLPDFLTSTLAFREPPYAVARMKQYVKMMTREFPEAEATFSQIKTMQKIDEIADYFKRSTT
jgi:tRNA-dihydrouridine synthase C